MSDWDEGRLFELATAIEREAATLHMLSARAAIVAGRVTRSSGDEPRSINKVEVNALVNATKHLEGAAETLRAALSLGKTAPVLMAAE